MLLVPRNQPRNPAIFLVQTRGADAGCVGLLCGYILKYINPFGRMVRRYFVSLAWCEERDGICAVLEG
jgi:hypothetical protein